MDMTLAELQEMAARQQQQIEAQQQLLASKVCEEEVEDESRDWEWRDGWIWWVKGLSAGDESKSWTRRARLKKRLFVESGETVNKKVLKQV